MPDSEPRATPLFVSYSHQDKRWLERLQVHLKPLVREGDIDLWDDTRIQPGADWKAKIEQALGQARVAVFLVSPEFLASDFIDDEELPVLLEAAEQRGIRILPVVLSHCLYAESKLGWFQAINAPDQPLKGLTPVQRDEVLHRLAQTIAAGGTSQALPADPPSLPRSLAICANWAAGSASRWRMSNADSPTGSGANGRTRIPTPTSWDWWP